MCHMYFFMLLDTPEVQQNVFECLYTEKYPHFKQEQTFVLQSKQLYEKLHTPWA
jgi:hypothetical protein